MPEVSRSFYMCGSRTGLTLRANHQSEFASNLTTPERPGAGASGGCVRESPAGPARHDARSTWGP